MAKAKQITLFSFLTDILYSKKADCLQCIEDEKVFIPFMLNRWITMYSDAYVQPVNETFNKFIFHIRDKELLYKLYLAVFPKSRYKKIDYIKKIKAENKKENTLEITDEQLAQKYELSVREIKEMRETVDYLNIER